MEGTQDSSSKIALFFKYTNDILDEKITADIERVDNIPDSEFSYLDFLIKNTDSLRKGIEEEECKLRLPDDLTEEEKTFINSLGDLCDKDGKFFSYVNMSVIVEANSYEFSIGKLTEIIDRLNKKKVINIDEKIIQRLKNEDDVEKMNVPVWLKMSNGVVQKTTKLSSKPVKYKGHYITKK